MQDLEVKLLAAGVVTPPERQEDGDGEDLLEHKRRSIMRGGFAKGSDDEDSDFD